MGQDDRRGARRGRQQQPTLREQDPAFVLAKLALMVEDSDRETVVSSGEDSGVDAKDWIRGLAQRATEPDFKHRVAKGPFVFVKPAFKTGRHFYANEELQRLQDGEAEARLRGGLKGKQFAVKGVLNFDRRGQPETFTVEDVAQLGNQPDAATLLAEQRQQQERILAALAAGEQKMLTDAARAAAGALQVVQAADVAVGRVVTAAAAAIQPTIAGLPASVSAGPAPVNSNVAVPACAPPVAPALQAPGLGQEAGTAAGLTAGDGQAMAPERPRRRRERRHRDSDDGKKGARHNAQQLDHMTQDAQGRERGHRLRDLSSPERQKRGQQGRRRHSRHADDSRPRRRQPRGKQIESRSDRNRPGRGDRHRSRGGNAGRQRRPGPRRDEQVPARARIVAGRSHDDRGSYHGSQNSSLNSVEKTEKAARKAYNAREQAGKQQGSGSEESGQEGGKEGWDLTDSEQGPEDEGKSVVTATARSTDPRTRIRERKAQVWSTSEEDEETITARRTARAEQRLHENSTQDGDGEGTDSDNEVKGESSGPCSNASGSEEDGPGHRNPHVPASRPVAAQARADATVSPQKPRLITSAHSTDSEDGVQPAGKAAVKAAVKPAGQPLVGKVGPPGKSGPPVKTGPPPAKKWSDDDDSN